MPTDPSVILQAGQNIPQFGPTPQTLLNERLTAAKLQLFNQQQQGANALRQLYQNPQNLDPRTGQPTPDAMRMLMTQSPETGLDLRQSLTHDAIAQSQLAAARAREGETVLQEKFRIAEEAQATYNEALQQMTPAAAREVAQEVWTQGRDALSKSGIASPDAVATMPTDYEPNRVGRSLSAYRQMMTTPLQQAQIGKERAETTKTEAETMALGPKTDAEIAKDRAEAAKATAESGKPTDRGELNVTGPDGKVKAVLAQQLPGGQWVTDDERRVPIDPKTIVGKTTPSLANQPQYSDDAVKMLAEQAMSGDPAALRSMWGGAGLKVQVMNALADAAKARWGDQAGANMAAINAMFQGDKSALTGLSKLRANVENFEGTALREANLALELAPKGLAGQSPAVNRWVQAGRQSLKGDADVTALNTAVTSLVNEYARIMSSPGASGGTTSDHARAEAAGLLNNAMNADQFNAAIATMKRSMANRVSAISAQIGTTVRDIQSGGGVSAPLGNPPENPASAPIPPAPAAPNAANAPPASMLREGYAQAFKNGQVWTLRNGAPVRLK